MSRPYLPEGEYERRRTYLAPLFGYLRARHHVPTLVARDASARHGLRLTRQRLLFIKQAVGVIPPWFVEECCAVIGRSVAEVMGDEWVKRYGEDGRGGEERAPVGKPYRKRTYRMADCHAANAANAANVAEANEAHEAHDVA